MKLNFRVIGKIGLLLVVFGFFMPMACDQNGFQLAGNFMGEYEQPLSGICLYLLFASALAGCIIGALLLMKKDVKLHFDWICVFVCIGSGLVAYLVIEDKPELQSGSYVVLIGWIVALVAQIISKTKSET